VPVSRIQKNRIGRGAKQHLNIFSAFRCPSLTENHAVILLLINKDEIY